MELREFMVEVLEVDDLADDSSMYNVENWDSLSHLSVIAGLEELYEVTFDVDEMIEMTSLASIKRILEAKGTKWT